MALGVRFERNSVLHRRVWYTYVEVSCPLQLLSCHIPRLRNNPPPPPPPPSCSHLSTSSPQQCSRLKLCRTRPALLST
ncbi:hypothetical protein CGRA01v4_11948 [Colletotrichum graminicola]|nr:hypothetical protein CGRA01v4_11948 [Colletotrichum graminicola]